MLVSNVSHDQKGHVALHFDHLDIRNSVVPITMLFASHENDAKANGRFCKERRIPQAHKQDRPTHPIFNWECQSRWVYSLPGHYCDVTA